MTQELSDADINRIIEMYPHNSFDHIRKVRRLLKSTYPGSHTWRILERDYGFVGDYDPADEYQADEPGSRN